MINLIAVNCIHTKRDGTPYRATSRLNTLKIQCVYSTRKETRVSMKLIEYG